MARTAKEFFSKSQRDDIKQAILNAELDTSGEIHVHIETSCSGDVMDRAAALFKALSLHKTEQRNGVLFYLAYENRKFAVIGDKGINAVVPDNFWDDIKHTLLVRFREGQFSEGLIEGIGLVGSRLKSHFPYKKGDVNELPDEVSFGEGT